MGIVMKKRKVANSKPVKKKVPKKKVPKKKVTAKKSSPSKRPPRVNTKVEANTEITLPTKYKEPSENLWDYTMLLYGAKKIGKTSTLTQADDPTFLMFEPGDRAVKIRSITVNHWLEALILLKQLEDDKDNIHKTIVIDVIDKAYDMCFRYMCGKLGIQHPQDENDFGKSWGDIKKEFESWVTRLCKLPKGVVFISHDKWKQVTRRDGTKTDMLGPTLSGQASEVVTGIVDIIAYYGYVGQERTLVVRGDEMIEAGVRIDENFYTTEGEQIKSIWMGYSKEDGYNNLLAAFSNEQEDVGELPMLAPPESRSKKKGKPSGAKRGVKKTVKKP